MQACHLMQASEPRRAYAVVDTASREEGVDDAGRSPRAPLVGGRYGQADVTGDSFRWAVSVWIAFLDGPPRSDPDLSAGYPLRRL